MAPSPRTQKNDDTNTPVGTPGPLETDANPTGNPAASAGAVGDSQVIDAQEHVLGDDPRRVQAQLEGGYHDSLSGRPVDADGSFTDGGTDGPIPKHRIVANNWPQERERIDDPAKREGASHITKEE
jgi:hypothetical protein